MTETIERLTAALADRYTIERELGHGGMARVYLALDIKHDRKVALKVLRPELAAVIGADRFLAEIRTTANLQHPHILPLHDSGEVDGTVFYVMPFVEGESLRARLDRERQLPVAEAVRIATEVAGALEYAHRKGIIHRDIKPANILLHDTQALVADFGIALAASTAGGTRMTETGMSLGTPHYMSPEQAMGERSLDARTDVYALGCVLHEMLVGEPPFTGPTAQAVVAKVMTDEPPPIGKFRKTVPQHLEDAVLTALQKLPADRFASASEFAAALAGGGEGATWRAHRTRDAQRTTASRVLWPIAVAMLAGAALWGWFRPEREAPSQPPSRLAILLPQLGGSSTALSRQLALTPDGGTLLYTAIAPDGQNRTMRLALDETEGTALPGVLPFTAGYVVSPDGREFIATLTDDVTMYRYAIGGGSPKPLPREITATPFLAWDRDGAIWFSPNTDRDRGIARLGTGDSVTRPFGTENVDVRFSQILPDGRTALGVRRPAGVSSGPVLLLDLVTGAATEVLDAAVVEVRYTAGHLVYALQGGALEAVPFDPAALEVKGNPVQIASGVTLTGNGVAQFAVAENGTVAYIPEEPRSLILVDRDGRSRPATDQKRNFHAPMFTPDGRRLVVDFNSPDGRDVWILSLDAGLLTRATFDRDGHDASWMPDGQRLTYTSIKSGTLGIYRIRPGSAERAESLLASPQLGYTGVWLDDGSALVTAANSLQPGSRYDIAIVLNGGGGPIEPVIATRFDEQYPAVSPDDRWVAFASNQSGQNQVYVRPLRGGGDQVQVSLSGGIEPVWGPDGRELFYRSGAGEDSELMVATVRTDPALAVISRRALFSVADIATATPHSNYDISPNGRTFAMVRFNPSTRIMVIQNLPALVRKLSGEGASGR
ncbi:MAG TPA: protein kinase [Gemmatimonadales bacterium]|nr:protein kinase [Gemmatimonadales bacterium]